MMIEKRELREALMNEYKSVGVTILMFVIATSTAIGIIPGFIAASIALWSVAMMRAGDHVAQRREMKLEVPGDPRAVWDQAASKWVVPNALKAVPTEKN